MKKAILIIMLSSFVAGVMPASEYASVVLAQKRDKDEKKDPPGPPVIKPKGPDKPKEPPPKKDRKPSSVRSAVTP